MEKRWSSNVVRLVLSLLLVFLFSIPVLAVEAGEGELTIEVDSIQEQGAGKTITLKFDNQSGYEISLGWAGTGKLVVTTSEGIYEMSIFDLDHRVEIGQTTESFSISQCSGEVEQIALTNLYPVSPENSLPIRDLALDEALIYQADSGSGCIWNVSEATVQIPSAEQQTTESAPNSIAAEGEVPDSTVSTVMEDITPEKEENSVDNVASQESEKSTSKVVYKEEEPLGPNKPFFIVVIEKVFPFLFVIFVVVILWQYLNPNSTTRREFRVRRLAAKRRLEEEEQYAAMKKEIASSKRTGKAETQESSENIGTMLRQNQEQMERYWKRFQERILEARCHPEDISITEEAQGIARNLLTTMVRGIWLSQMGSPIPEQGEENRLELQINRLADTGLLSADSRGRYHQIRKSCNDGAHAKWVAGGVNDLAMTVAQEVFRCVTNYNLYLKKLTVNYLERKLSPEVLQRMDGTPLWKFIKDMYEEITHGGNSGGSSSKSTLHNDSWNANQQVQQDLERQQHQIMQNQMFQDEVNRTQQQFEQEILRENQRQFDQFSQQSVTNIQDGGFIQPPPGQF